MTTNARLLLNELDGLRALARSLVHGDADDLLQDAAVTALAHPPADVDRPVRGWLATVLRNRWRMDRRAARRRQVRELAAMAAPGADERTGTRDAAGEAIDRARALEKLATALVALDEPFRSTVIRRYLDGEAPIEIARALRVPAGTVRWRLKTGLARLRAALDESIPPWQRAFAPFVSLSGAAMKTKTTVSIVAIVILLLLGAGVVWRTLAGDPTTAPHAPPPHDHRPALAVTPAPNSAAALAADTAPVRDPLPGQGRARVERMEAPGGTVSGRVINWSTGDGVPGAELTFTSDGDASTVRTGGDGSFELAPPAPGSFTLSAIAAPGFLPYAPELLHSTIHLQLAAGQAVRGITVFLFPAVDYRGLVVDARGTPVAGARVRLLGTPKGEQMIDRLQTEWTTDRAGQFVFHAADRSVLEAARGDQHGWARLDDSSTITRQLKIQLGDQPAQDATITGRAIDATGAPISDVLVRGEPAERERDVPRTVAFATTGPDGGFVLTGLDRIAYDLAAETPDHAPAALPHVQAGARDVLLTFDHGASITGAVVSTSGDPVPAYTLLLFKREGAGRSLIAARSVVEPRGRFSVRVLPGEYELTAAANGLAPSPPTLVSAGASDVILTVSAGGTLRGVVVDAAGSAIGYARVMREGRSGGASAQPANAGTVTRGDGSFELTGIPPGRFSITVTASGYHPRIESGLNAADGDALGPIQLALNKLAEGEAPKFELVGIGISFSVDGDALRVERVIPSGGAEAAGIVTGDRVMSIDGVSAAQLGIDGAAIKIRGVIGTTVSLTLRRGDQDLQLIVQRRKIQV